MTHLSQNRRVLKPYCRAVPGSDSKVTTSAYFADCLDCFRQALHQSKTGLIEIQGVLRAVGV